MTSTKKEQRSITKTIHVSQSQMTTLSSLVYYIQLRFILFKLEDSNVHDKHSELAVNETVIPSFSTKFTFALLSKMLSCGLTVMSKYTLTLTTNAKKKASKKRSGKSKIINHSLDG